MEGDTKPSYVITAQEIEDIYEKENLQLSFSDKLSIVVQRIYQHYKGYSSIDEVRDMNIDGVSGGVSGLPESFLSQVAQTSDTDYLTQISEHRVPRACDSIWIFFQGKSIRLAFLSFGTEAELKRVCQNIYKYNNPGQLSDTNGYKINEMKDGSRVVVVRPSFSETWAFFVRKFDVKRATLEQLVRDPGKEEVIELFNKVINSDHNEIQYKINRRTQNINNIDYEIVYMLENNKITHAKINIKNNSFKLDNDYLKQIETKIIEENSFKIKDKVSIKNNYQDLINLLNNITVSTY